MKTLDKRDLEEYLEVTNKLREMTKLKDSLRAKILSKLDQGYKAPKEYNVIADTQTRANIPWQVEAERWQQIAAQYAERLGITESEFSKHYVEYPPTQVVVLRVSRR